MMNALKREWPVLFVIGVGAALQLALITRSLDFLLANLLLDDAFYYFEIARNFAEGLGSTFDGINPTNGYHPLWMTILVPVFTFFSDGTLTDLAPIRAALALSLLMNVATALVVSRILVRFTASSWVRSLGVAVWFLNPFLLYQSLNGLETPLALLLFSIFFLLVLRLEENFAAGKKDSIPAYALLGVVGGLMILARLDMAFFFTAFLGWLFLKKGRKSLRPIFASAFPAGIFLLAWIAWNVIQFNMLLTSSSLTEYMVNHQLIIQDHGASTLQALKATAYHMLYALEDIFRRTGMSSVVICALGAALALFTLGGVPRSSLREMPGTLALFCGFLALFVANAGIRWTMREWYFVSFGIFVAILITVVASRLFPLLPYRRTAGAFLAGLALFSFLVSWSRYVDHSMPQHIDMYAAAEWQNANLSSESIVGVFNAGIQGYFSAARVVNLDGLVNNAASDAMRHRALWEYVRDSGIEYIADFDIYLAYRYKSFFGADPYADLSLVHSIPSDGPHGATALNIYRVQ